MIDIMWTGSVNETLDCLPLAVSGYSTTVNAMCWGVMPPAPDGNAYYISPNSVDQPENFFSVKFFMQTVAGAPFRFTLTSNVLPLNIQYMDLFITQVPSYLSVSANNVY